MWEDLASAWRQVVLETLLLTLSKVGCWVWWMFCNRHYRSMLAKSLYENKHLMKLSLKTLLSLSKVSHCTFLQVSLVLRTLSAKFIGSVWCKTAGRTLPWNFAGRWRGAVWGCLTEDEFRSGAPLCGGTSMKWLLCMYFLSFHVVCSLSVLKENLRILELKQPWIVLGLSLSFSRSGKWGSQKNPQFKGGPEPYCPVCHRVCPYSSAKGLLGTRGRIRESRACSLPDMWSSFIFSALYTGVW